MYFDVMQDMIMQENATTLNIIKNIGEQEITEKLLIIKIQLTMYIVHC